jgi:YD repeat-containing protein
LSYWYKNGAAITLTGATVGPAVVKNTRADWTLAEREITYTSGTLTISGTGNIDEVRLHPYDAQMTTYTYDPLIGLKSTIDAKGKIQNYEYDDFQRLQLIRDQDGNIIKAFQYYKGTSNN